MELEKVFKRRITAQTAQNESSSRTHLMMFIEISVTPVTGPKYGGSLSLIDLAGNEDPEEAKSAHQRKEAININMSLVAVGTLLRAVERGEKDIGNCNSYAITKLMIARNILSPGSKTFVIINISAEEEDILKTKASLDFAKIDPIPKTPGNRPQAR